jgi:hypothetical protein
MSHPTIRVMLVRHSIVVEAIRYLAMISFCNQQYILSERKNHEK